MNKKQFAKLIITISLSLFVFIFSSNYFAKNKYYEKGKRVYSKDGINHVKRIAKHGLPNVAIYRDYNYSKGALYGITSASVLLILFFSKDLISKNE